MSSRSLGIFRELHKHKTMDQTSNQPWPIGMTTLSECMELAASRGYHAEFGVGPKGMSVTGTEVFYAPEQVHIHNFYRFEGASNPDDMSILYLIETSDGQRGTLVDAYGAYSDSLIDDFIRKVEDIKKQQPGALS